MVDSRPDLFSLQPVLYLTAMVLRLELVSESPGGLVKTQNTAASPEVPIQPVWEEAPGFAFLMI